MVHWTRSGGARTSGLTAALAGGLFGAALHGCADEPRDPSHEAFSTTIPSVMPWLLDNLPSRLPTTGGPPPGTGAPPTGGGAPPTGDDGAPPTGGGAPPTGDDGAPPPGNDGHDPGEGQLPDDGSPPGDPAAPPGNTPPPAADEPPTIGSLRGVSVPEPENLGDYIKDKHAAIALGKALFWDMQAGSDGVACATCHFHAGADNRLRNQLSPGLPVPGRPERAQRIDDTASGGHGGPNYLFKRRDFPFHQLSDVDDRNSEVVFDTDDIASSQGVFRARFNALVPGEAREDCELLPDLFQVAGLAVRRVEPRNTPTVINAVFNFRNFWDGRANERFNGVSVFGRRDPDAAIHAVRDGVLVRERVDLARSSLASQAVGPALNAFEMSCEGRTFPVLGRKLLGLTPLGQQEVDPTDSVLGALRHPSGKGLDTPYARLIQAAFHDAYWSSDETIDGFSLMESNFSFFWGLAIQVYEATLVSDDSRFDRFASGDATALSEQEREGLVVFVGKGQCVNCHHGPELSGAASSLFVEHREGGLVERMRMGDNQVALYDSGFYNIGVRPTEEDLGLGAQDPFGFPLSFTRQATRQAAPDPFRVDPDTFELDAGVPIAPGERDAVDGAFKTPSLRNVELTGPYFHNGGTGTLEQVVDFYNRGGDRRGPVGDDTTGFGPNASNLDPDIEPLGLTDREKAALVAFLKSLTDDRVRMEMAPFDHPQLIVAEGHYWNTWTAIDDGTGRAREKLREIPAVGAAGRRAKNLPALKPWNPW